MTNKGTKIRDGHVGRRFEFSGQSPLDKGVDM